MQKLERRQYEEGRKLAEATEQTQAADMFRQELAQVRALAEVVKAQEEQNTVRIAQLSEEHTTIRNLEVTRSREEDLQVQLHLARAENEEVTKMLEKERILRAQAIEQDCILQQRISEADKQRSGLELQLSMCHAERDQALRQLKDTQSSAELVNVDAKKARERLTEVEYELKEAKETESSLRSLLETSRSSQSDCEQRLEDLACKLREVQSSAELAKAEVGSLQDRLQQTEHVERLLRDEVTASRASQSDSEGRIEDITRQLKDARASIELANRDAASVRAELQQTGRELGMAKQIECSLREELKATRASQSETQQHFEDVTRQLKEAQANTEVVNNEALGLKEELRRVTHELADARGIENSLRVDLEAVRASHLDAESRFKDATRRLEDAESKVTDVREGLQRVEDTLSETRRIGQSLREELMSSRISQSETQQRLDDVTQRLEDVQSNAERANTDAECAKEELRRVEHELRAVQTVERSLRDDLKASRASQSEAEKRLKGVTRQLKDAQSGAEADKVNMQEKLCETEHELREAKRIEGLLRDNLVSTGRGSQLDFEQRLEESNRLIAQLLDVAITFRGMHHQALLKFQSMTTHPNVQEGQVDSLGEASCSFVAQEPPPVDTSDVVGAVELLREFDRDYFLGRVTEVGSVIRKWQKQCKIYRDRAKGKMAFRDFSKGDLALFLPTRNSPLKPWAAFNSEAHHF